MIKIQFGCGGKEHALNDWINHDIEVDIRKPLPYESGTVSRIFAEHLIEHVTSKEMINFFFECYRILEPNGAIRVIFPDCMKIYNNATLKYENFLIKKGWLPKYNNPASTSFINIGTCHKHVQLLTGDIVLTALKSVGFNSKIAISYQSTVPEFNNIDRHWIDIGKEFNELESVVVEGIKT